MIVYHGSDSNFRKLRISKDLVKHRSTLDNEGLGIYFSTDIEVAKSYGKYVYTLEINDNYFLDFRRRTVCRLYIGKLAQYVYKNIGVDILSYFSMEQLADRMYWGGQTISGVGKEISLLLDSNEAWFGLPKTKIEKVLRILKSWDKKMLKSYMFNYHIKNIGVIKDVSEDVVRIIEKRESYLL